MFSRFSFDSQLVYAIYISSFDSDSLQFFLRIYCFQIIFVSKCSSRYLIFFAEFCYYVEWFLIPLFCKGWKLCDCICLYFFLSCRHFSNRCMWLYRISTFSFGFWYITNISVSYWCAYWNVWCCWNFRWIKGIESRF